VEEGIENAVGRWSDTSRRAREDAILPLWLHLLIEEIGRLVQITALIEVPHDERKRLRMLDLRFPPRLVTLRKTLNVFPFMGL